MYEQTNEQSNKQTSERTNEKTNEQTNEQTSKRTNKQTNERTNKRTGRVLRQQPTLWSDVFQAERGWGDFEDNDYVKEDEDEPQQRQGKQLGRWVISNMMTRMTTRTR